MPACISTKSIPGRSAAANVPSSTCAIPPASIYNSAYEYRAPPVMQPCNLNPGVRGNGLLLKTNLLPKGCLSLKCSLCIICLASTSGYTEIELSFVFNCRRLLCVDAYSTSTYRNWLVSPLARRGVNLPGSNLLCLMFSATSTTFGSYLHYVSAIFYLLLVCLSD